MATDKDTGAVYVYISGMLICTHPTTAPIDSLRGARVALLCLLALGWGSGLGGCTAARVDTPPPPMPTAITVPAQWSENVPAPSPDHRVQSDWWRSFGSSALDAFVTQALQDSPDLWLAAQRIRQAQIALGLSGAAQLPSLGISAGSTHSERTPDAEPRTRSLSTSLGLSLSYEIDLWGRIAANVSAAQHSLNASQFDYEALRLSLIGNIASTYFQTLATRERLHIAQENLTLARRILAIAQARFRSGVATRLEVSQQSTTVLSQEAALIPLSVQERQLRSALALLLGQSGSVAPTAEAFLDLRLPSVWADLPATLLTRRPDLAAAQANLAASDANLTAARAALLPSVTLSASGGLASGFLLDLTHPTRSMAWALSLAHSIFDGGRLQLQSENARSQQAVQLITYGKLVRSALKEVEDGLGNVEKTAQQEAAQQAVLAQAQSTLELAERRYREGVGDLQAVLEAQRSVFAARDQTITLRLARLQASIDLNKALGGGWALP